jgi:hypothetical protein
VNRKLRERLRRLVERRPPVEEAEAFERSLEEFAPELKELNRRIDEKMAEFRAEMGVKTIEPQRDVPLSPRACQLGHEASKLVMKRHAVRQTALEKAAGGGGRGEVDR